MLAKSLGRRIAAARVALVLPFLRLRHHLPVISALAVGHLLALVLILVVPLYADGVNSRLLQETLRAEEPELKPRNSLTLRHSMSVQGPITGAGFDAADELLHTELQSITALPTEPVQTFAYSDKMRVWPSDLAGDLGADPITWISLGYDDNLVDRVEVVEGRMPAARGEGETLEVLVSQKWVNEYGIRSGDTLVLRSGKGMPDVELRAEVVGVWRPRSGTEARWPLQPVAYDEVLLVPQEVYRGTIGSALNEFAWYSVTWYTIFPEQAITVGNTGRVRAGFAELKGRVEYALQGKVDFLSPDKFLAEFETKAATLRTLLFVFSVPTLAIVVLYIVSTSNLFAERQRAEIAVLRGRGISSSQIGGAYLVEGMLVDLLPLLAGPLLAFGAAQLIGRTEAFLQFGPANQLPLRITPAMLRLSLLVLGTTILVGLVPVLFAARQTLVSYQQQVVREARRPLWQRLYLDFFVLIAAGYGYYALRRQGSLVPLSVGGVDAAGADPFNNPLSLLLPALGLFGCALLVVRVFPALASLLSRAGQRVFDAPTLLALRHLARSPYQASGIVLLTTLTLALGAFSATMATTLDRNDADRINYANGAALRIGESAEISQRETRWTSLPAWEHGEVDGVEAYGRARVLDAANGNLKGAVKLLALDRAGFHDAGWWRDDLADEPLGQLMNTLAAEQHALLVSRSFLSAARMRVGDTVSLTTQEAGGSTIDFVIRGVVDHFPMLYTKPEEVFAVGNYDYVFLREEPATYDVLLKPAPGVDVEKLVEAIGERGFSVDEFAAADELIAAQMARPERVGFVGLLSLGFVAATGLTMLALLLYSLFSFRRRMVEIGVLRAAGLSVGQMVWLLGFELCFLTISSAFAGIVIGVGAARLFVPYYQLGNTIEARTPPFEVVIAWGEIGRLILVLAIMLLITLLATTAMLRRLRIYEAVKLGQELG